MARIQLLFLSLYAIIFSQCTSSEISSTAGAVEKVLKQNTKVSTEEVSKGLKEALVQGISKGTVQASQVNGYYQNALLKILIPPEMQLANAKLRDLGMNKLMDDFEISLNRAAEEAAKQAKPIFVSALTSLSISDAWNILKGESDAATVYLRNSTGSQLESTFQPIIQKALQRVNATKYYKDIVNVYNKIPAVEKINPDLDKYVTGRAIDGLFVLVKQEEANIRANPIARTTELLKRVFSEENVKR